MVATILIATLVLGALVLSLSARKIASSKPFFFVALACTAYLVVEAIGAWVEQDRVFAHNLVALTAVIAVLTMLSRLSGYEKEGKDRAR